MIALRNSMDDSGENKGQLHVPGSPLCDFKTLCGSCWDGDDNGFAKFTEVEIDSPKEITCDGCLDMLRAAKPYVSAVNLKKSS